MQRRPCSRSSSAGSVRKISWWSRVRVRGSRSGGVDPLDLEEPARIGHQAASASSCGALQRALVVVRDDLDEGARRSRQHAAAALEPVRSRCSSSSAQTSRAVVGVERLEADQRLVAARRKSPSVEHVGDPAAHARREVAPGRAEHDDVAAGHVLAAVVAAALDDRVGAGVADREALARQAAEERPAARRAVERRVARDHVLVGARARAGSGRTAITPPERPLPA